ncbi:GNAT family N-acetyltransferase [Yoonia sp. R2331]|uniref:GNAT family N-acetyltransferase n=1 Tax=Yoonia sp. R2331 TaxID=3237238 RepID=UPI0034E464C1
MTLPDIHRLYDVVAATWPAANVAPHGPWQIRTGKGGGRRVSAATASGPITRANLAQAEAAMHALSQTPLFMIREGEDALDALLADAGYVVKDPSVLYAAPAAAIATERPPPVTAFTVWPPLAVQRDIWAAGGIGDGRLAVMSRAPQPKTSFLGRINDRPAATVFVGVDGDCAMIHALEVAVAHRKQGLARHLTRAAAFWALEQGCTFLTLVTTEANAAANHLYSSLGMTLVGRYHYRTLPKDDAK